MKSIIKLFALAGVLFAGILSYAACGNCQEKEPAKRDEEKQTVPAAPAAAKKTNRNFLILYLQMEGRR